MNSSASFSTRSVVSPTVLLTRAVVSSTFRLKSLTRLLLERISLPVCWILPLFPDVRSVSNQNRAVLLTSCNIHNFHRRSQITRLQSTHVHEGCIPDFHLRRQFSAVRLVV